ncbi:hypothetical protein SLS58_004420 [Diplodia intermedia]|uniref:Uncharacterized protein n=1 Tax=Diplodia intermedia TaxID=856260 RepID=A0ABR3TTH3_9PEZI
MAGLEVVGVVLGSIPLIISALEHYADGASGPELKPDGICQVTTVRNMCEYEYVFLTSQSRLVLSIAIFRQSCRELLQDLPDDEIRELVDLREGWGNEEVKAVLRRRLAGDDGSYRVFVRQLNKRIDLLCRKLKLRDDLSVPFLINGELDEKLRKDFFKKSWSRIRGGFNSEKHQQLVADIRDDIDQLCAFTKGALDLEMSEGQKSMTAHSSPSPSASHPKPDKKKAKFVVPILKIDPTYDQSKRCSPLTKIDCLCSTLGSHCHIQRYCLGFIPGGDWHYHLHNTAPPSKDRALVPLHDALDRKKHRTITTRQNSDIHVDPQSHTLYVIKEFTHQGPGACAPTQQRPPQADVCVKNHALFFLTIALLELTYGAPLTTHRTPADLDDAYTPYRIAERLTRQIQDDELPKFAGVVGKCMYPTPEGTDFSLQNEAVRKRFWSEVILPLREDWEELVTDPQHVFQDISG